MANDIRYLNTDLDLAGDDEFIELADAFKAGGANVLSAGKGHACICKDWQQVEPEVSIAFMVGIVESLPEPLRNCWMRCTLREFNIGYDCGDEPWAFNQGLSSALLGRLAAVGASLRITIYPVRPEAAANQQETP